MKLREKLDHHHASPVMLSLNGNEVAMNCDFVGSTTLHV